MMAVLLKFIKFALVGCSGLLIDFGITWLLKERLGLNRYVANTAGFCLAVCNNYYWNRVWTFTSRNAAWQGEFERFVLISIIGLLLNNVMLWALHGRGLRLPFYMSKGLATAVVLVWNFTANFLFTFG